MGSITKVAHIFSVVDTRACGECLSGRTGTLSMLLLVVLSLGGGSVVGGVDTTSALSTTKDTRMRFRLMLLSATTHRTQNQDRWVTYTRLVYEPLMYCENASQFVFTRSTRGYLDSSPFRFEVFWLPK